MSNTVEESRRTSAQAKDIEAGIAETTGAGNATAVPDHEVVTKEKIPDANGRAASPSSSSIHSAEKEVPPEQPDLSRTVSQAEGYGKSRIAVIMFSLCVSPLLPRLRLGLTMPNRLHYFFQLST